MAMTQAQRLGIFLALALVMALTRGSIGIHHFEAFPVASWGVFFLAGFWLRGAGGLTLLTKNANADGRGGDSPIGGIGGLFGGGLDLARWGYFVIGLEGFGAASVSSDGLRAQLSLGLGFSYY